MKFDIIRIYSELTKDCPINKLGEKINYYQADDLNSNLLVRQCIELDMTSAFPSICRLLYTKSDPLFIERLSSIDNKLEKNIFLTNYLKDKEKTSGINHLIELTNYAKIFTLSNIYNNYENINILEFKKDGAIFTGEPIQTKINELEQFNVFHNFSYHSKKINLYLRFNKTSILTHNTDIDVKGMYKEPPKFIIENLLSLLLIHNNLSSNNLKKILKIYNTLFLEVLYLSNMFSEIMYYLAFNKNKYITTTLKLEMISMINQEALRKIDPFLVVKQFIFPILSLLRAEK